MIWIMESLFGQNIYIMIVLLVDYQDAFKLLEKIKKDRYNRI